MSSVIRKKQSNGNLVLAIKVGDALLIDGDIAIKIKEIPSKGRVVLVVNAPRETRIRRRDFEEKRNEVQGKGTTETQRG